jgi:hypothetical protein
VAGSGHEFYTRNAGQKRAQFKGKSREGQDSGERLGIMKPTQLVSYFSKLPIVSSNFSKVKALIKQLLELLLIQKRILLKTSADVSMTSATAR